MDAYPVDPHLAMAEGNQSELVRRKLEMDALRSRLGDSRTTQQKLREACEGFESIFLQKMWEQMRKNVPKEGYLHSKEEDMYQSLFDVELCKKMASAGGIGLADMIYEQLSQQLENTGRTTTPGRDRALGMTPAGLMPEGPALAAPASRPPAVQASLDVKNLYSPLDTAPAEAPHGQPKDAGVPREGAMSAVEAWAQERAAMAGLVGNTPPGAPVTGAPETAQISAAAAAEPAERKTGPIATGPIAAGPDPTRLFGRITRSKKPAQPEEAEKQPPQARGMAPQNTLWPVSGDSSRVVSRFGWEDDPVTGKRHWNSGVAIEAPPNAGVRAVLDGVVIYAGDRDGFGHSVVLEHKDGYRSYYSNIELGSIKVGDHVTHGAEFAKIAAQPSSSAQKENSASLYFELKKREMAINPESAIKRPGNAD